MMSAQLFAVLYCKPRLTRWRSPMGCVDDRQSSWELGWMMAVIIQSRRGPQQGFCGTALEMSCILCLFFLSGWACYNIKIWKTEDVLWYNLYNIMYYFLNRIHTLLYIFSLPFILSSSYTERRGDCSVSLAGYVALLMASNHALGKNGSFNRFHMLIRTLWNLLA